MRVKTLAWLLSSKWVLYLRTKQLQRSVSLPVSVQPELCSNYVDLEDSLARLTEEVEGDIASQKQELWQEHSRRKYNNKVE